MKVFYNHNQSVSQNNSFSPSAGKPYLFVKKIKTNSLIDIVSNWQPISIEDIYLAHDKQHVDNVLSCKEMNGFENYSKEIADSLVWSNGSFYRAAKFALLNKTFTLSPTSGFHHATYNKSMCFCTFNGLIISAILLKKENLINNVGIIDFDRHYGNGTDNIIDHLSIDYISHIGTRHLNFDDYQKQLNLIDLDHQLNQFKNCDILFYQAGADIHEDDPLGGFMPTEQMILRDKTVFQFAKDNNIPLVWNLAGGYQEPIEKVLDLHINTLNECLKAMYGDGLLAKASKYLQDH